MRYWTLGLAVVLTGNLVSASTPKDIAVKNARASADGAAQSAELAKRNALAASEVHADSKSLVKVAAADKKSEVQKLDAEIGIEASKSNEAHRKAMLEAELAATAATVASETGDTDVAIAQEKKAATAAEAAAKAARDAETAKKAANAAYGKARAAVGLTASTLSAAPVVSVVAPNGIPPAPVRESAPNNPNAAPVSPAVIVFNQPISFFPPNLPHSRFLNQQQAIVQIAPGMKLTLLESGEFAVEGHVLTNGQAVDVSLAFELMIGNDNELPNSIHLRIEPISLKPEAGTPAGSGRSYHLGSNNIAIKALKNDALVTKLRTSGLWESMTKPSIGNLVIEHSTPAMAMPPHQFSNFRVVRHAAAITRT